MLVESIHFLEKSNLKSMTHSNVCYCIKKKLFKNDNDSKKSSIYTNGG